MYLIFSFLGVTIFYSSSSLPFHFLTSLLAHFLTHLDAPTKAPSWPSNGCTVRSTAFEIKQEKKEEEERKEEGEEKVGHLSGLVGEVCAVLIDEKERLNEIDSHVCFFLFLSVCALPPHVFFFQVGDGDTGDTFSRGASEINSRREKGKKKKGREKGRSKRERKGKNKRTRKQ